MDKVRLGIIGCGGTTRMMFGPILKYLDNGELVAVMDPVEENAKWAQEMYGAKEIYQDLEGILASSNVDAVIIGSPVFLHCDQVMKSAQAGKNILCEKPMARSVDECDQMIKVCEENRVILMVAFMKRFNKCFRLAKEMIKNGELGDMVQVRMEWGGNLYEREGWRASLATWGGLFQDLGSHTVDLCRWWLGEIETVNGEVDIFLRNREVEDHSIAIYRHGSGALSLHYVTRLTHKILTEQYEITGTKGTLQMEYGGTWSSMSADPFRMTLFREGKFTLDVTPYNDANLDLEIKENGQYLRELRHFCDCIINNKQPLTSAHDGRKAIEIITATYLSSWKGEKIKLPLTKQPDLERLFKDIKGLRPGLEN